MHINRNNMVSPSRIDYNKRKKNFKIPYRTSVKIIYVPLMISLYIGYYTTRSLNKVNKVHVTQN